MKVVLLHANNPGPMTGAGNWTYLVPGASSVLVDAGVGRAEHLEAIAAHAPAGPSLVVVTHAHPDHISGAPALAQRWPRTRFAKRSWFRRDPALPWRPLADGDRIATEQGDLEVVFTPGHAPDHIALWHAPSRSVFTGDLLVAGSTVVIPVSQAGSLSAYLESLRRVAALDPVRAYPAHGPVIDDPRALIEHYLQHRAERERQVLEAVAAGHSTIEAITDRIYVGLAEVLVPQAHESVRAHLQKLQEESRAIEQAGRWSLVH